MCGSQEIQYYFYGVEGFYGNFHKEGVPVTHGAVPETGKFKGLEFTAFETLGAYEAGLGIYVVKEVEFTALVVLQAAHKIYGIEVSGVRHRRHCSCVILIDLDTFEDLEAGAAILACNDVGTAAGFTLVLHHAAYADGTVEFFAEHLDSVGLTVGKGHLDAEFLVKEVLYFVAKLH